MLAACGDWMPAKAAGRPGDVRVSLSSFPAKAILESGVEGRWANRGTGRGFSNSDEGRLP